uniref:Uncharacterized protein n=1 Tax=Clytia hemisphaerica TaxID=252671 RepID=A0A7M5WUG0_9CNID|eukprot:TCONS_00071842-protein
MNIFRRRNFLSRTVRRSVVILLFLSLLGTVFLYTIWRDSSPDDTIVDQKNTFIFALQQNKIDVGNFREKRLADNRNQPFNREIIERAARKAPISSTTTKEITAPPPKPTKEIKRQEVVIQYKLNRNSELNFPSIFNYLPHLIQFANDLEPIRLHNKSIETAHRKPKFVFGIPTVKRLKKSYLVDTIRSILAGMKLSERSKIVIVVYIGEKDQSHIKYVTDDIVGNFTSEVQQGLVEVIAPPEHYYPDLDDLPLSFGDPKERVKWRSKQNLDYSYMMMYAQQKAEYYLQLEDDVIASKGYLQKIEIFMNSQKHKPWFMLEFCRLGFIGKLFHSQQLSNLIEFFLMFYKQKPNDWLLDHYIEVLVCSPEKGRKECNAEKKKVRMNSKPSLFQHVGKHSSLKGKVQKLIDRAFPGAAKRKEKGEDQFFPHDNIKATIQTNAVEYSKFKIKSAYEGHNLAWIKTPKNSTFISFHFDTPVKIEKFLFRTGNKDHPGDVLKYGMVEVQTAHTVKHQAENHKDIKVDDNNDPSKTGYVSVGTFNDKGLASGTVPKSLGDISELRLRVTLDVMTNWVIINEFMVC